MCIRDQQASALIVLVGRYMGGQYLVTIEVSGCIKPASGLITDQVDLDQISLFDTVKDEDILKELDELDISNLTPLDALNTLYRLQNLRKNRWQG